MPDVTTWQDAVLAGGREKGVDSLVEIVVTALVEELPVLQDDPDLVAGARSSSAANIAVVVEMAEGTVSLNDLEPPPQATAFARELARRNVPVADLGHAYRVAQRALWRWAVDEVHERVDDPTVVAEAVEDLAEAVFATGDVFITAVMQRYALERERWLRSADAVRSATVKELLSGGPVDIAASSKRVRYELRQEHQGYVVWAESDSALPEAAATAVGGPRALVVPIGVGIVAGWAPVGTIDPTAAGPAWVALGSPGSGLVGFRTTHHEAMEARRVARLLRRVGTPTHYDEIALLGLLTQDLDQARVFAERRLGALAADDDATQRLAETLQTVLEERGSPRRAAKRLGVHENTVAKRLRTIEQLIGEKSDGPPAEILAALVIRDALRQRD
ncbi:MAG: helix-turn-helix domain-containing protein [Solirubrobacteraceae bacterium]|nr:helix-turn-helix domain-containing protein [Solirubrobacteraceae bacterium]